MAVHTEKAPKTPEKLVWVMWSSVFVIFARIVWYQCLL